MELQVKPHIKSTYPKCGILIQGNNTAQWITEIQRMNLVLSDISVYPLPYSTPNSVWGCLVILNQRQHVEDIGKNSYCQLVAGLLFIPDYTKLYPVVTDDELKKLLGDKQHILHPAFGFAELHSEIQWGSVIEDFSIDEVASVHPAKSIFIPREIKSFQIAPVPEEEILEKLRETIGDAKNFEDKLLSGFEKMKLATYKQLLGKDAGNIEPGRIKLIENVSKMFSNDSKFAKNILKDYEQLYNRNQNEMDKLMKLLKDNPEEALKYAIPLDEAGSSRGGEISSINLSMRNYDFSSFKSLVSRSSGTSGSYTMDNNSYYTLRNQYFETARKLIEKKEYMKASFVYIKLLKDYHSAVSMFEDAKMYQEAASICLELLEDKKRAAVCYEKGNMTTHAIDLYKELKEYEKVGDLYSSINQQKNADKFYEIVAGEYTQTNQFLKASLIYRKKMHQPERGQQLLLESWRNAKTHDRRNERGQNPCHVRFDRNARNGRKRTEKVRRHPSP